MVERGTDEAGRRLELSVGGRGGELHPGDAGAEVMAAPAPRRRQGRVVGAVAVLMVAFAVGWGIGYDQGSRAAPAEEPDRPGVTSRAGPAPTAGVAAGLAATGEQCAVQVGTQLWLGVELVNGGSDRLVLRRVRVNMPLGGLEETSLLVGACGQLGSLDATEDAGADPDARLDASATAWVSGIFDVLTDCPAPYPVQFLVDYTDPTGGNYAIASGSFSDLGDVDYSRCP